MRMRQVPLREPRVRAGALALTLALICLVSPSRADAHAGYERSSPADGEVVAESPAQVEVFFGQEMARSGGLPSLVVVNQSGDQVNLGSELDDADRTRIVAPLAPALPDGRYTVIWHTLSDEDGEEAQGAFHFFVGEGPGATPAATEDPDGGTTAPASPTAPATPSDSDGGDDDDGGVPVLASIAGVIVALGGGVVIGLVLGRRRQT